MKTTFTLKNDRGWELLLEPQTDVERDILSAARKGNGVAVECRSIVVDDVVSDSLIVTGTGSVNEWEVRG